MILLLGRVQAILVTSSST